MKFPKCLSTSRLHKQLNMQEEKLIVFKTNKYSGQKENKSIGGKKTSADSCGL